MGQPGRLQSGIEHGAGLTAVPSVSIGEGQSIAASSLIASVSNPNGDAITEDIYQDLGGGSGYFTVNGAKQPDSVWIDATPSEDVQYVAGSSPGSDTLGVGVDDATTNSNFQTSTIATTIHVAPVVTAVPSVSIGAGQSIAASCSSRRFRIRVATISWRTSMRMRAAEAVTSPWTG